MILPCPQLITSSDTDEVVYLSAPIHTFYEPEYERAIEIIRERHPNCDLLLSRCMFSDSRDFVLTYREKLLPVEALYLLPDRRLRVGAGVYTEWEYLKHVSPNCKEALVFDPNGDLRLTSDFTLEPLILAVRTMREFATLVYLQGGS